MQEVSPDTAEQLGGYVKILIERYRMLERRQPVFAKPNPRLVAQLYEERSRRALGDFALTKRIHGYWDRNDTEIDLVAIDEDQKTIRFGNCKRNPAELLFGDTKLEGHVARFLAAHPKYIAWTRQRVAIAPTIGLDQRAALVARGALPQDLHDLTEGL